MMIRLPKVNATLNVTLKILNLQGRAMNLKHKIFKRVIFIS